MLDQAHFLPSSSFFGFQNVEFEHVSSSKMYCFFEFKHEFVSSISSIGSSNTIISYFFEFKFIQNPNHRARVYLSLSFKRQNSSSF